MAILAFVALGIAVLLARSLSSGSSGFDDALVAAEARQALAELQTLPYDHPWLDLGPGQGAITPADERLVVTYEVFGYRVESWQDVQGPMPWPMVATGDNLKQISVTVTPRDRRDNLQPLTVSALKVRQ
jgi:hypothetical protein